MVLGWFARRTAAAAVSIADERTEVPGRGRGTPLPRSMHSDRVDGFVNISDNFVSICHFPAILLYRLSLICAE